MLRALRILPARVGRVLQQIRLRRKKRNEQRYQARVMHLRFDKKILPLLGFRHLFHDATIVKLTLLYGFGIKMPFFQV